MLRDFRSAVRRAAGLLLLAACTAGAAEPPARIEQLRSALLSTGPELTRQFVIARAEIEAGRAEDGWTPELKTAARTWLDGLTSPATDVPSPVEPHLQHPRRLPGVAHRSSEPHHLPPPAALLADTVAARLRAVIKIHHAWWGEYCDAVAQEAEHAWLHARNPSELRPVLRVLEEFKAIAIDPGPATGHNRPAYLFSMVRKTRYGVEFRVAEDEPVSALLLLSGSEPLLLSDPATDPETYKEMRLRWHDLDGWQLRFCGRFRISNRVRDLDRQFNRAAAATQTEWERLIVTQAPLAEIAAAWGRLETFHVPTEVSPQPVPPRLTIVPSPSPHFPPTTGNCWPCRPANGPGR